MLEVHGDVVTPDIGSHCNNRCRVKLSNQVACRYTVQVWHNDIHQDQIVL